jgi:hypothetical protein
MEPVQEECLPDTPSLSAWRHCQALDEPSAARRATDGVADHGAMVAEHDPEAVLARRPHRLSEPGTVKTPERSESGPIDLQQTVPASRAGPAPARHGGQRRERDPSVQDQQVEVLVDFKTGLQQPGLLA